MKELEFDSGHYELKKLPQCTKYNEIYPIIVNNTLYFISDKTYEVGVKNIDSKGSNLFRIYSLDLKTANSKPTQVLDGFLKENHEGPFYINPAEDHLFYTSNKNIQGKEGLLVIKEALKDGDDNWIIKSIPFFDSLGGSNCHPYLFKDEKKMIFASNTKGEGGMDLFTAEYTDGKWGNLKNLGGKINTKADEAFPTIDADGNIYFASNRSNDKANFDLYFYNVATGEISLLGAPFNTNKYESGIKQYKDVWYLSTDRDGNDDICTITFKWPDKKAVDTVSSGSYCYEFKEESSVGLSDTTIMAYEWDLGDGTKTRSLVAEHCYRSAGDYQVSLNIIDKSTGVPFFNQVNYLLEIKDEFRFPGNMKDSAISWRKKEKKDSVQRWYVEVDKKPYYSGLDSTLNVPAQWTEIKEYYTYLDQNKWDTIARMRLKGHKEKPKVDTLLRISQPPDLNFRVHIGGSDSAFSIKQLSTFLNDTVTMLKLPDNKFHYFAGNYDDIDRAYLPVRDAKSKGFFEATAIAFDNNGMIAGQNLNGDMKKTLFRSDYILLYSVNYEPSKFELSSKYKSGLDSVLRQVVKAKKIKFYISSFTDPSGSRQYNEKLSNSRSLEVKKEMLKWGIPRKKIRMIDPSDKDLPIIQTGTAGERVSKIYIKYEL